MCVCDFGAFTHLPITVFSYGWAGDGIAARGDYVYPIAYHFQGHLSGEITAYRIRLMSEWVTLASLVCNGMRSRPSGDRGDASGYLLPTTEELACYQLALVCCKYNQSPFGSKEHYHFHTMQMMCLWANGFPKHFYWRHVDPT
jgi:hypothetical protein